MPRFACGTWLSLWASASSFGLALSSGLAVADGSPLDLLRAEVREPQPESSNSGSSNSGSSNSGSSNSGKSRGRSARGSGWGGSSAGCDDDSATNFFAALTGQVLISPFTLPMAAAGDDHTLPASFSDYPYDRTEIREVGHEWVSTEGFLVLGQPGSAALGSSWYANTAVELGHDFTHDLERVRVQFLVETSSRFGLESGWDFWSEGLDTPQRDDLLLGDLNLTYRFAQCPWMNWRAGGGLRWLADDRETNFGWNLTYGADFFPGRPWIMSGVLDYGSLGHEEFFQARATAGWIRDRAEVYLGYDFTHVGSLGLHGPIVGLRVWY